MNTDARVQVGELEDLATPFQRHYLPLQSLRQGLWVAGAVLFVVVAGYLIDRWYDGGHSMLLWLIVALGAFAGAIPAWIPLLPARFRITTDGPARAGSVFAFVKEKAVIFGYRQITVMADGTMLSTRRFQRLGGKENRVLIADSSNVVSVTGPVFAIRRLHRICQQQFSPAKRLDS